MAKYDDKNFNFIRVKHNGETISIVQHTLEPDLIIQEVAILPEMETPDRIIQEIVSYDGSLESLIETLQTIKNYTVENAQC